MHYLFFTYDQVLKIHEESIGSFGGAPGIRDINLLKSALAQPSATFHGDYLHKDLYEMAAAYLFHTVNNHPFIDGNKRTGALLALIFLSLHEVEVICSQQELYEAIIKVAEGKMAKEKVVEWLRRSTEYN